MVKWIKKNKLTTVCLTLIPILTVAGILGISPEKQIVRPYVTAIADTVFVKKHDPCEKMIYANIGAVKDKVKSDREFIAKMYYYQKAMLTKEQKLRAEDDMASDSSFKRFIAGN